MGVEELKKLMTEIKDISETDPNVDAAKVLEFIQDRLQETWVPEGK